MTSPRAVFQKFHKEDAKHLAETVVEPWFQKAIVYARAQMQFDGMSLERILGANHFVELLATLADEEIPPQIPPDKSALPSYK